MSATPAGATLTGADSAGRGGLFAHVDVAGLDPEGVVDDAVHDRVGVDPGAEALVPVLLRVLGAEHRRGRVVSAFEPVEEMIFTMGPRNNAKSTRVARLESLLGKAKFGGYATVLHSAAGISPQKNNEILKL